MKFKEFHCIFLLRSWVAIALKSRSYLCPYCIEIESKWSNHDTKELISEKNYWKSWNCEMIIFILKCKRWRHCNNVIVMTSSRRREISDDALARISLRFVFTLWNKHSKTYSHWKMMPEKKFQPEIENLALKTLFSPNKNGEVWNSTTPIGIFQQVSGKMNLYI